MNNLTAQICLIVLRILRLQFFYLRLQLLFFCLSCGLFTTHKQTRNASVREARKQGFVRWEGATAHNTEKRNSRAP